MFTNLKNEVVEYNILQRSYKIFTILILNLLAWYFFIFILSLFTTLLSIFTSQIFSIYIYNFTFSDVLFFLAQASTIILGVLLVSKNIVEIAFKIWLPNKK